jgi:hypothetical protein
MYSPKADKPNNGPLSKLNQNRTSTINADESVKYAMSNKMKDFGPKVKKNSSGMNMLKMLTGSNLISALQKGITKKSKFNIGKRKTTSGRTINIVNRIMGLPDGGSGINSMNEENISRNNDVLQKMFNFMILTETIRQRRSETERSFREERDNEIQRRHEQFLRVLSEFTGVGAATKVEEKKSGGILDMLKGLWDSFIKPFKWALDWVMNNKKLLLSIARFFAGPLGVAMLAGGAIIWLAEQLKEYFRNNVPDMKIVSPSEAANLLSSGNQKDIDKFPGGEKALREIIENAPKRATEILARGDNKEILAAGGEKKLKEIETDIIAQPPKRDAILDMSQTVAPREKFIKYGRGTKATNAAKWDKEFGPYYDPETGKRLQKINPIEPMPKETKESVPTAAPVSTAPTLGKVNDSIAENNALNLEQSTGGSSDTKPIIMQNNKSNQLKDTPISATATTRDQTPIMEHVRRLSTSPI